jgi:hypothetical protein
VSDVLWDSLSIDAGRLFTRSGDSGSSGDALFSGNSKVVGGSMFVIKYATEVVAVIMVVLLHGELHDLTWVCVLCV